MGVLEALGVVEDLHYERDGGDVTHVAGIGVAGTASKDAAEAATDVGDARPGVPFGGERLVGCAPFLFVDGNDRPLPRLLVLADKIVAGVRRNVVCLADGHTSLGAVLEDGQARLVVGIGHGWLEEGALRDLVLERHATVG